MCQENNDFPRQEQKNSTKGIFVCANQNCLCGINLNRIFQN